MGAFGVVHAAEAVLPLSIGVATAGAVGLILSWRETDVEWLLHALYQVFARGRKLVGHLCDQAAARHGGSGSLGRGSVSGRSVGLSDVVEMIDVVRLGLSAGLSFDSSLELYCGMRRGELPTLLQQAVFSWRIGLCTRRGALDKVAAQTGIRALESFAAAVSQALEMGAPLAETLAGQSREIRIAHRAEVEREIERAPVKLIIPTGTLILPALLLSILGPLLAASGML